MNNINFLALQNGSDIRGNALGENINLTPDVVSSIAASFLSHLAKKLNKKPSELTIGVGHDSRLSSDMMSTAVINGLNHLKANVIFCGLASTPSMFMGTVYDETKFDGSIMITASHLPSEKNGLKFFDSIGGFNKSDIKEILLGAPNYSNIENNSKSKFVNLLNVYSLDICSKIKRFVNSNDYNYPLKGLKIVVDCGNGAGGFFVDKILKPLGADTTGSLFLDPDGSFPNHLPNPESKEAISYLVNATIKNNADLGIIFDTDVDRMSAVLPSGQEINRDGIIAIISSIIAKDYPGGTIVTDSVTSDKLTKFLQETLGLKHLRYMRGYRNVINKSIELNEKGILSPLAIETSGHGALKENYFLDDGAYLALKLLVATAIQKSKNQKLEDLLKGFEFPFETVEYRIPLIAEDFKEKADIAIKQFEDKASSFGLSVCSENYEGIRVYSSRGWMLIRKSLHEPLLPLNIEGNNTGDCEYLSSCAKQMLSNLEFLDLSKMK